MSGIGCTSCGRILVPKGEKGDTGASGALKTPIVANSASLTLTGPDTGALVLLDRTAGVNVTLPSAPADGTNFTFQPVVDPATGNYAIATGGTDIISGYVYANKSGALPVLYTATAGTETAITLNGTTSGGKIGTSIDMIYSTGVWYTSGTNFASGATITPFS